ncbi:MAG: fibronectin type III domain-containing protein [Patescibacteria group bacterium]|jgi:hypothetical protein
MVNKKTLIAAIAAIFLLAGIFWWFYPAKTGSATLSWNPNTEFNLAGYRIYYGPSLRDNNCPPGGYPEKIDVGKTTDYKLNNLVSGRTYYFSITSYNTANQESCFSEEGKKIISHISKIDWLKSFFSR